MRLTLSIAKVRTVYSASVSVFSSVILMSPQSSVSSGQYLQHFICTNVQGDAYVNANTIGNMQRNASQADKAVMTFTNCLCSDHLHHQMVIRQSRQRHLFISASLFCCSFCGIDAFWTFSTTSNYRIIIRDYIFLKRLGKITVIYRWIEKLKCSRAVNFSSHIFIELLYLTAFFALLFVCWFH